MVEHSACRYLMMAHRRAAFVVLLVAVFAVPGSGVDAFPSGPTVPVKPCPVLPADNIWHADVSALPVEPRSAEWLSHMSASTRRLHPDFGPSYGDQPVPYGIPITRVRRGHAKVTVRFTYADESDRVRYPLGSDTLIEGGANATGDRHALMLDSSTCTLYETFDTRLTPTGWTAGSGAVYNLRSNALRPAGWTSADAAGLPILPGLLRYAEVRAGRVDHAIRFTTDVTDRRYIWPARHQAGSVTDPAYPPMGARFRLKASFPIGAYSPDTQVVLRALKAYGLILADNGSPWFLQGTADTRWPEVLLDQMKAIPASAFEAVATGQLQVSLDSGQARQP